MNELLDKVSQLIDKSNNIPNDIKSIVKTICRGYIRESKGKIPIEGIINVCNTKFVKIEENDKNFAGANKVFATTETNYDKECNVIHEVCYINDSDYIKLISILTHELGHVITESEPCKMNADDIYPYAKRTTTIYKDLKYEKDADGKEELLCKSCFGYRMADGFLESISTKIFASEEFREELSKVGYDLKDYVYKDERIFPSRIYDEYKACFELFDYIMDGTLFDFSCMSFNSNDDLKKYFDDHKLNTIFEYLDNSNNSLWKLKEYEGKEWNNEFDHKFHEYLEKKKISLELALACLDIYGKSEGDKMFQELYDIYSSTLNKQKLLPIPDEYLEEDVNKIL